MSIGSELLRNADIQMREREQMMSNAKRFALWRIRWYVKFKEWPERKRPRDTNIEPRQL